jgi:hypothetical protein
LKLHFLSIFFETASIEQLLAKGDEID